MSGVVLVAYWIQNNSPIRFAIFHKRVHKNSKQPLLHRETFKAFKNLFIKFRVTIFFRFL